MSHRDGPPPVFKEDDFSYWKIRMEAYLEAIDVESIKMPPKALQNLRIPLPLSVMRFTTRSEMQRLETPSLEAFVRTSLTVCRTTKTPMHYGWTFMCSMREPRLSVRNTITL
jgi:hypothetical protein